MPLYEFECQNCGKVFEELVSSIRVSETEITCPHCGFKRVKKLISAPAIGGSTGCSSCGAKSCSSGCSSRSH
ncbi:MAG TPA: zinc ribbon domain-containing protein [Candidatus Marinimicrobia bacterium]|nr:zinc ribbon domain-containing protein [Candidatus Neomarinimicrobiota bacterium]HRS52380.1 zinc ribbon domain-containing protein [Candidatus Neomarinimicrobiota bacterium]HRU93277.1 zinc ribbon domain-containing protein [Candidatus Neomarinimicrobiota bacterium]